MSNNPVSTPTLNENSLTKFQSVVTIAVAFLGWFFGGTHMATNGLAMRTAGKELLRNVDAHKTTDEDTALGTDLYEQLNTNAESGISLKELDHKNAQSLSAKDLKTLKDRFSTENTPSVLTIDDLIGSESEKRFNGLVGKWAGFFVVAF